MQPTPSRSKETRSTEFKNKVKGKIKTRASLTRSANSIHTTPSNSFLISNTIIKTSLSLITIQTVGAVNGKLCNKSIPILHMFNSFHNYKINQQNSYIKSQNKRMQLSEASALRLVNISNSISTGETIVLRLHYILRLQYELRAQTCTSTPTSETPPT